MKSRITLFALFLFGIYPFQLFSSSILVPLSVDCVKQNNTLAAGQSSQIYNTLNVNVSGGDSLLLVAGTRNPMRFDDLLGDSLNPIVVCNKDGKVIVTKPIGGYYGITFNNSRYVKLSGKNNTTLPYGIWVTELPAGSAVSINNFSSNFEVEGIEISRVYSSGIVAKTDMNCANILNYPSCLVWSI